MAAPLRLLIIADALHEPVIGRLLDHLPIDTCWVTSPDPAATALLQQRTGLPTKSDLRTAAQQDDLDAILVLTREALLDDEWAAMRAAQRLVFVTEPFGHAAADDATMLFAPRFSNAAGANQLLQTIDEFGEPRSINIAMHADPPCGSIGARLRDALDAAVRIAGPIEAIYGRYRGDAQRPLPDSATGIDGHIAATFQHESGVVGSINVSNVNGPWSRRCVVCCDAGTIHADDQTCRWQASDDDTCELPVQAAGWTYEQHLAKRMLALLTDRPNEPPPARRSVSAAWLACWLSCRTGQVEHTSSMPVG